MDYQEIYDEIDALIINIDYAIRELNNEYLKDYKDRLNEIKYELKNDLNLIEEKVEEEYLKEEIEKERNYWKEVI